MCIFVWLYKCVCTAGASQKRASALLGLELQVVVSHRRCWELDSGLQQSRKCSYLRAPSSAPHCLNHIGSSPLNCTLAVSFSRCWTSAALSCSLVLGDIAFLCSHPRLWSLPESRAYRSSPHLVSVLILRSGLASWTAEGPLHFKEMGIDVGVSYINLLISQNNERS